MKVVYAIQTALVTTPDGGRHPVHHGEVWRSDDPVVLAQPYVFSSDPTDVMMRSQPAEFYDDSPVETVTAAPGEKRGQVRRG